MNRVSAPTSEFAVWWWHFRNLARSKIAVGQMDEYREYWEDGDSPEDALESELQHIEGE